MLQRALDHVGHRDLAHSQNLRAGAARPRCPGHEVVVPRVRRPVGRRPSERAARGDLATGRVPPPSRQVGGGSEGVGPVSRAGSWRRMVSPAPGGARIVGRAASGRHAGGRHCCSTPVLVRGGSGDHTTCHRPGTTTRRSGHRSGNAGSGATVELVRWPSPASLRKHREATGAGWAVLMANSEAMDSTVRLGCDTARQPVVREGNAVGPADGWPAVFNVRLPNRLAHTRMEGVAGVRRCRIVSVGRIPTCVRAERRGAVASALPNRLQWRWTRPPWLPDGLGGR